ncbi:DUF4192 family protein [Microbacterium sp. E-13]|uniref:DUF4192 family protein n=1 Tax=Microbacterium sp. E-13 TaxID=3404048 RepID=UPI003CEE42E8
MTDAPTIVKASSPADLLAVLPFLAGGPIPPGIAIAPFAGRRTPAVLRHDLPSRETTAEYQSVASRLLGMVSRLGGCDGVAIAIYTDDPVDVALHRFAELEQHLLSRFRSGGFVVIDTFCVGSDGWACFDERTRRPLSEIAQSPAGLTAALDVQAESCLNGTLPKTDAPLASRVAIALADLRHGARADAFGRLVPSPLADPIDAFERMLTDDSAGTGAHRLAELIATLQTEGDYDRVLVQAALGPDRAADHWAKTLDRRRRAAALGTTPFQLMQREARRRPHRREHEVGELLCGQGRLRPDRARLRRAAEIISFATAHAPRDDRPTMLCVLAWLHWALGMGSSAGRLLTSAAAIRPEHELTALLNTLTVAFTLPSWVLDRDLRHGTQRTAERPR